MSAIGHTPGPWRVSQNQPTIVRRDFRPIAAEGELIASACGYPNSGCFPSDDESIANARLIAAAPELLEALQSLIDAHAIPPSVCKERPAFEVALAAIAKATGFKS